jgi:hypothetical protein
MLYTSGVPMIIRAYLVESHRMPAMEAEGLPLAPEPVLVGLGQFMGGSDEWVNNPERDKAAIKVLMNYSPLRDHVAHGLLTWRSKAMRVDDEHLGPPWHEDIENGYRVWIAAEPPP